MADVYNTKIEILRKKSRTLLAQLAENSKNVENEIEKLNIDRVISSRPCISEFNKKALSTWLIRNDSTRVSELLNPPNQEMTVGERILITSKHPGDSATFRKAVPGCYCNRKPRKVQYRSPRTISNPFEPCHYCKSHFDVSLHKGEEPDEIPGSPGINTETLQRVQSITYTPRSEFLRRVQKKVSQQFNICAEQSETPPHLSREYSSHTSYGNQDNHSDRHESRETGGGSYRILHEDQTESRKEIRQDELIDVHNESTIIDPHPGEIIQVPVEVHRANDSVTLIYNHGSREKAHMIDKTNESREKSFSDHNKLDRTKQKSVEREHRDFSPDIEIILPPKFLPKKSINNIPKKTISSTKRNDEKKKHKKEKSTERSKKNVRKSCHDSSVNNRGRNSAKLSKCADCSCHSDRCLSCLASIILAPENDCDKKVANLRKFREKNYYDTHDSSQTILSSISSGSLEKFELNNRLFPEPIGRLHKDSIMISMPPCATKQLKRIHYFPRHIVREDKKSGIQNSNEKRRHRSCPLTGHAIDVGLLKPACPSNSLALKYQKGTV